MEKLVKINRTMGLLEYLMYQDIPIKEIGSSNPICGASYASFQEYIKQCIKEETEENIELHNATTNRYIYYVDNYPIGEVGIRTHLNYFWENMGSQIFYKVRVSERGRGYGMRMLRLALKECKRLGFQKVRINCNDKNVASQKLILNSGGKLHIEHYKTTEGTSSSYIVHLNK